MATQDPPQGQDRKPFSKWKLIAIIIGSIVFLVTTLPLLLIVAGWLLWIPRLAVAKRNNCEELARRRPRYEEIVRKIAAYPIAKKNDWATQLFEVSMDRDPDTLKPFDQHRDGGVWDKAHSESRFIRATREPDGRLVIEFLTQCYGHMGDYWLVYTDRPQGFDWPKNWHSPIQIAPNWWAIHEGK